MVYEVIEVLFEWPVIRPRDLYSISAHEDEARRRGTPLRMFYSCNLDRTRPIPLSFKSIVSNNYAGMAGRYVAEGDFPLVLNLKLMFYA